MRTVDEAGKLGRAFRLGLAFAFGKRFCAQGVASDEARWITVHPNGRGTTRSGDNDEDGEVELTKDAPEEAVKSFQEFKKVEEEQANQTKYLAERCLDGMKE